MKKILYAACALFTTTAAFAQAPEEGFHVGLNSGYYYNLILDQGLFDSPTYDHQRTWNAAPIGLTAGYQWQKGVGVQLEVISAKLGQNMDIRTLNRAGGEFIVTGKKEIEMSYIQIPLLFKLQTGSSMVKFAFVAGPQISLLTKGRDSETFSASPVIYTGTNNFPMAYPVGTEIVKADTENEAASAYKFNRTAVGAVIGLGLDVYVHKNVYISGMLRAGYNFTELREEGDGGQKYVDQAVGANGQMVDLYKRELRNTGFAGFQLGVHYLWDK